MHGTDFGGLAVVFLAAVLTNNILFSQFMGMCSFIAISRSMKTAVGMGLAVTFVTFCTAVLNYWIYEAILVADAPLCKTDLTYLTFLVFIMTIAGFVQLVEMILERFSPMLHFNLGIYLPLITVNCAILGGSLFMVEREYGALESTVFGFSSGVGWLLAIASMAAIRKKLRYSHLPDGLKGLGITTEERNPEAPKVMTAKEQGIDLVYGTDRGIMLPKGTSQAIIQHYSDAMAKAAADPAYVKAIENKGSSVEFTPATAYVAYFKKTYSKWERIAKELGAYKRKD